MVVSEFPKRKSGGGITIMTMTIMTKTMAWNNGNSLYYHFLAVFGLHVFSPFCFQNSSQATPTSGNHDNHAEIHDNSQRLRGNGDVNTSYDIERDVWETRLWRHWRVCVCDVIESWRH